MLKVALDTMRDKALVVTVVVLSFPLIMISVTVYVRVVAFCLPSIAGSQEQSLTPPSSSGAVQLRWAAERPTRGNVRSYGALGDLDRKVHACE